RGLSNSWQISSGEIRFSRLTMTANKATIIFLTITIVLATLTFAFGYTGYSLNGYLDSMGTMPAAVSFAIGHGFKDQLMDLRSSWGDPTGQERYLWFPPFFSLVISAFVSPSISLPPSQQALLGAGILSALAILLAALVFYKIATLHGKKFNFFDAFLACAFLIIMLRSMWSFLARPEGLEIIFLAAGFLMTLYALRERSLIAGFAVVLGLMVVTHPFGALFFGCFAGLALSFFYEWRRSIAYGIAVCLLGAVAFVIFMQASPYGIAETWAGIAEHNAHEMQRINSHGFPMGFLKSKYAIMGGMMIVLMAAFCAYYREQIKTVLRHIKAPLLFAFFAVLIVGLTVYFVVVGHKTYYALLPAFFMFSIAIYFFVHIASVPAIKYTMLIFAMLFAALSLKPIFAFPAYIENGLMIAEAREIYAPIAARYPEKEIYIEGNLWALSEDYERMHVHGDITSEDLLYRPLTVIGQNAYDMPIPAPTAPAKTAEGCPLLESHFVPEIPTFFGIQVTRAMPGYGFAVYLCE
ncbi:MAG: hypothetical protein Q7S28_00770, partial [bacterium]|nr:hypothetical protein [bacterium]